MLHNVIIVPDGYNGETIILDITPIREDGPLVLLRCIEVGKEHLTRWVYKDHIVNVNKMVD